jgi:hypothetical protein
VNVPSDRGRHGRDVLRCVRAVLAGAASCLAILGVHAASAAAATTYYVNCSRGSDGNAGTSRTAPWSTVARVNQASLQAGDTVLFHRGCSFQAPLNARWSGTASAPITFGAYGKAGQSLPRIQNGHTDQVTITGSYLVLEDLAVTAQPWGQDPQCQNAPIGDTYGFHLTGSSHYDVVRDSTAFNLFTGIDVDWGASHHTITGNTLTNDNVKDANFASDAGADGILLSGDDNNVSYNRVTGSDTCSRFYVRDGTAIEIYGGQGNNIHDNTALQNNAFAELGNSRSANNTYAYNLVVSSLDIAGFLVTRGATDSYGPVVGTRVFNNTVMLTGAHSYAIQCTGGCSPAILSLHNNIVWSQDRIGYADHAFDEGNNLYWRPGGSPPIWFPIASSSRVGDPQWVAPSSGDFRLKAGSPAINAGTNAVLSMGYASDLLGFPIPWGGTVDMGAYEYHT